MAGVLKPVTDENHHWWPKSLFEFWKNSDGKIIRLLPSGLEESKSSNEIGAIFNGHHWIFGPNEINPWNGSLEPDFQRSDTAFPGLIKVLESLDSKLADGEADLGRRLLRQKFPKKKWYGLIGLCLASLIARSPRSRAIMADAVRSFFQESEAELREVDNGVIVSNIAILFSAAQKALSSGAFAILFSDSREFICGDGFFHNFQQEFPTGHECCLVPLTPTIAVAYFGPSLCPSETRLQTLRLRTDEVEHVNQITQVYSKGYIFYRSQRPKLIDAFKVVDHYVLRHRDYYWLEQLRASFLFDNSVVGMSDVGSVM